MQSLFITLFKRINEMKVILVNISLIFVAFVAVNGVTSIVVTRVKRAQNKYTTKYDNFDVEGVLASARLVKYYGRCLLDKGPCPPEGSILKDIIPDAISSQCSKCSDVQKKQAGRVLEHLLLHYRDLFLELSEKYDKDGKARKMYGIDTNEDIDYSEYDEA